MRNSALLACRFRLSRIAVVFPLDTQTGETPQRAANALAPGLNVRPRWLTRHEHCHRRLSHRVCQTLVHGSRQVVRGRCRTLGLRFEIGSPGKMSDPCQGTLVSAQWWTGNLPGGGHEFRPVVAMGSARRVATTVGLGQGHHSLAGEGLGQAHAVAAGLADVGVVQQPVDGGGGQGLGHEFVEA